MPPPQHLSCMVRRHAQEAVQSKSEIDEHEKVDGNDVGEQRRPVGQEVEGEAAEPDHEDKSDEQEMVGATHLLRPAKQQQERGERGQQKGGIACGVERLREQRFAPSPLAIKEHVLAQPMRSSSQR